MAIEYITAQELFKNSVPSSSFDEVSQRRDYELVDHVLLRSMEDWNFYLNYCN